MKKSFSAPNGAEDDFITTSSGYDVMQNRELIFTMVLSPFDQTVGYFIIFCDKKCLGFRLYSIREMVNSRNGCLVNRGNSLLLRS